MNVKSFQIESKYKFTYKMMLKNFPNYLKNNKLYIVRTHTSKQIKIF